MLSTSMFALMVTVAAAGNGVSEERPLEGDVVHGQQLLTKAGGQVRVDGAWINAANDDDNIAFLAKGARDFPQIDSDDVLDRWDVLALLRSKNTDLRDIMMGADTVCLADEKLDENAEKRLTDAHIKETDGLRVFGLYKLGDNAMGPSPYFVPEKDTKKRDKLKKNTKVGYVVFAKLPGFRGGKYEVAFAVDKDIHLQHVEVRAPDGEAPVDLNQAAARFVGKGARGKYEQLKAGGAGKAIGEIEKPLSDAFLVAMENVYMYEIAEKDFFAFSD